MAFSGTPDGRAHLKDRGPFDQMNHGVHKSKKLGPPQGNVWERYSDSTSTTSAEEGGKGGGKGRSQRERPLIPPLWSQTKDLSKTWYPPSYKMRPANRGRSEWTQKQEQVKPAASEESETRQSTWSRVSEIAAESSYQSWRSTGEQIGWRTSQRSAPTTKELGGSDYTTDHEWRETKEWHSSGWASDPSQGSQNSMRAKPTHTDPSDDQKSDAAMASGTTSKTWQAARNK